MRLAPPLAATLAFLLLLATGCTPVRNPATGELQYTTLTPAEEAKLGREEAPKAMAEFGGAYADPALQAYVTRIGNSLAAVSETPETKFTFTVLDTDIVNAFALPGGYVYVTRGLIALTDNEAELAGVLGHEIGHVTARHTAQRYDRQIQGQLGATVAQLGGAILGGLLGGQGGADLGGNLGGQLGSVGATAYVQGYSREQEFQADELGVRYLSRDGYDPQAMASFLDTLNRSDALKARLSGQPENAAPSWLASHPRTVDRVERAIAEAGAQRSGGEVDQGRFLAAIDGLVFGDSPAQGFVRGRTFVHPQLGFRFEAPAGFTLRNSPQAVTGTDGRERYMIFDSAQARAAGDPAAYLQGEWVSSQRLRELQRVEVNGRTGAVGFGQVGFRNRPAQAMFAVLPGAGRTMYRFVFLDTGRLGSSDVAAFDASLRSFGSLSPGEAGQFRPLRIDIVEVRPGDTIDSLAARMDVPEAKRDWFVLLNDLSDRPLVPGEKVKLVVRGGPGAV